MKLTEQKVLDYAVGKSMLSYGDRIVVGVSGGADSICLLLWLSSVRDRYGLDMIGVHVHHGIRGEEADRDMQFTARFCESLGVELVIRHYDVPVYAKVNRLSEEEAGRRLRYAAFKEVLLERQFNKIAVAHHSEDSAETIIFNMVRGSRASGIRGIMPMNGDIIRPLMCLTRKEIEEYLGECGVDWCIDSTNSSDKYSRNRIRETIIPAMKMINSRAVEHILETGEFIGELHDYLEKNVKELYTRAVHKDADRLVIDTIIVKNACRLERLEVIKKAILELTGSLKDITSAHIMAAEELIHKQSGKKLNLPYNIEISRNQTVMYVGYEKKNDTAKCEDVLIDTTVAGSYILPFDMGVLHVTPIRKENANYEEKYLKNEENIYTKFMDCDRIEDILTIRTRKSGDYLLVNHGKSKKKLKEYFIDNKIPHNERDSKLLITEADGHVLWVLGHRISDGGKLSADTKQCVEFKWIKNDTEDKEYEF